MPKVLPINSRLQKLLQKYSLQTKFEKQIKLLSENPGHPSLNLELLEPKIYGIYSIRINRKFRALLIFRKDKQVIEILNVTVHYR